MKDLRRAYPQDYGKCQARILTYMGSVRKVHSLLQMPPRDESAFWAQWDMGWQGTVANPEDAAQLVDARDSGISAVISDDSDWVSIEGIRLFTANRLAIQAARLAGKLAR